MAKTTKKGSETKVSRKSKTLTVERVFDASPETLWSYWTDPEKFAMWFNPAGIDLVVHTYQVREGGRVRFDMPQPNGDTNPQEGVFHVLERNKRIVSGSPDKSFLIDTTFTKVGKKTRMSVTVSGVPPEYRDGARVGWNAGFDHLADALDAQATAGRSIAATRVFDAPRERVWTMWTQPDQVAQWWGPEGFTNSIDTMDVRKGGVWTFVMHGPDGRDYDNEIKYVEVREPERLVYDHGPSPRFRTTVTFVDLGKKTKITMRGVFDTVAIRNRVAKEYGAVEGMLQTLERLAGVLANRAPDPNAPRELVLARVFNAPRARVWKAWTEADEISKWWGPKGFTAPGVRVDFRVGGTFLLGMRGVGLDGVKRDSWNIGEYREILPLVRFVASMRFADADGHVVRPSTYGLPGEWPEESLLSVTFEDLEGGRTKVTLRQRGLPEIVFGMTGLGWNQSLDKLAASLPRPGKGAAAKVDPTLVALKSDREVLITRVFDFPREQVFKAYLDPKALEQWWGPREYSTEVDTLEPRTGGAWRFINVAEDGTRHAFRGKFLEVAAPERLAWTFEYEPVAGHVSEQTVKFEEMPGRKTKVIVVARFATQEDLAGMVAGGMEFGMRESYQRLEELLGKGRL